MHTLDIMQFTMEERAINYKHTQQQGSILTHFHAKNCGNLTNFGKIKTESTPTFANTEEFKETNIPLVHKGLISSRMHNRTNTFTRLRES